ncbi:unknown [Alistipes sp. CAG:514]|nr:unknown [Alistipes sp. CAG:514]
MSEYIIIGGTAILNEDLESSVACFITFVHSAITGEAPTWIVLVYFGNTISDLVRFQSTFLLASEEAIPPWTPTCPSLSFPSTRIAVPP